jgi:hypothetical protein
VLIFALLVGANFADRYSLDRVARNSRLRRSSRSGEATIS